MTSKNLTITIISVIVILLLAGGFYYYFFIKEDVGELDKFGENGDSVDIFPPGETPDNDGTKPEDKIGSDEEDQESLNVPIPKLRKIHVNPVAGAVFVEENDEKKGDRIRFMERATGHMYETWTNSLEKIRISNTTIPKVQEVFWNKSGNELIVRYLDENLEDIITYYAEIKESDDPEDGSDYKIEGSFLQKNILHPSISENGDEIFYFIKNNTGISGVRSKLDGSNSIEIFSSPITEWLSEWFGNEFLIKTKPTFKTEGFIYKLDNRGQKDKILSNIKGLTSLGEEKNSNLLYTKASNNSFEMFSYNLNSEEKINQKQRTIPEKCVWSKNNNDLVYCGIPKNIPRGEYPDDWYQGLVSFDDILWVMNVKSNLGSIVVDPENHSKEYSDITKPKLNEEEKYLIFVNKKDYSLWGVEL